MGQIVLDKGPAAEGDAMARKCRINGKGGVIENRPGQFSGKAKDA